MVETRPARPEDEPFLFTLYAATREAEVSAWGWSPAQQQAFLGMQYQAQARSYAQQFPAADHQLICRGGDPVGRILVHRGPEATDLVDIALLPAYRGAGAGTALIRELQAEGRPVRLHVLKGNPAQRLYERLGFRVAGDDGVYLAMQWHPATGA